MKKNGILLLTVILFSVVVMGCSQKTNSNETDAIVVGFIYNGSINDGGNTTAHDNGRVNLEEQLGEQVKTIYKEDVPEDKSEVLTAIRKMVDQGAAIIFTTSFGHMEGTIEASKEFPNIKFAHCSGYQTTDNMTNYYGRMYQARYLSGIVAGMKTETNKIAYVATFPIAEVIRGINAFTLGAKSVNPDVEVQVRWTNILDDPSAEKAAVEAMLNEGCDVTAQHQDSIATMIAAEENNATSIGYNVSAAELVPNAYITAPMWNWDDYYLNTVEQVIDGTWTNLPYWGSLSEGIVYLDKLTSLAPEGAEEKVIEIKEKILLEELQVFSGEIKDQDGNIKAKGGDVLLDEDLLTMDWFVDGVVGTIPAD